LEDYTVKKKALTPVLTEDVEGKMQYVHKNSNILTPVRYFEAKEVEDDGEPFNEKMKRLTAKLKHQCEEFAKLEKEILKKPEALGYGN
jgi:type I restriction enzyme M protein